MMRLTRRLSVLLIAVALMATSTAGWSIVVGPNPGGGGNPNPLTTLPYTGPVYKVLPGLDAAPNYTLPPTVVDLSDGGPYWLKNLVADDGDGTPDASDRPVIMVGDYLVLKETLTISGREPWYDWHETIIVEGWSWINGAIYQGGTTTLVDGFQMQLAKGDPNDPHFEVINFYFDELTAGTTIDVVKILQFQGFDTPSPNDNWGSDAIIVREFPTQDIIIPEPATMGLLALGGGLLGFLRRRRK